MEKFLATDYEIIKAKFGGELLYVKPERMLYTFNTKRSGKKEFVCYQTVLSDCKKKKHADHLKCFSRVRLLSDGTCERMNKNIPHTLHPDHKNLADDKKKMINMNEKCQTLKNDYPENAHKIPLRHIYQREIAK